MPWLDLLTEDDVNFTYILLTKQWENRSIDGVKHLGTKWADIIEIEFKGVYRRLIGRGGKPSARKLGCESHVERFFRNG